MKPTYQVKAWKDDGWWLARVTDASDGADRSPLNALTQAKSLAKIEEMARDLIATILDEDEEEFEVRFDYGLPTGAGQLLDDAAGARAWLDAAQVLWQERAVAAARALTAEGFSLREVAHLLGLSHQRVDQLLGSALADSSKRVAVLLETTRTSHPVKARPLVDAQFVLVVAAPSGVRVDWFRERLTKVLTQRVEFAADDIAASHDDHEHCQL
ncbi:hypothetical protein [Symbioplanes lichenis]|uniref:hypothetical protein n=1 Tax=Symbioplanes lichenis TaxID=1629072 RepID=UPI0027382C8E|nr:hypothetical protein [Actinoplanes lichenis]